MSVIDRFGSHREPPSPSQLVRRWDQGLLVSSLGFAVAATAVAYALWRPLPGLPVPDGGLWRHFATYPQLLANTLSFGHLFRHAWVDDPAASQVSVGAVHARLLPACVAGVGLAVRWGRKALRPYSALKHVSGPQLIEGKEAEVEAQRFAANERGEPKVPGFLRLHPLLDLSKRTWCRHVLVAGSVGSGKTQIIWPIVQQIRRRKKKLFLLDVKGDYTSAIRNALILSPWDRRSVYLDIAADLRTSASASTFASAMVPKEEGSNGFFSTAAELILTGCIRSLQRRAGARWGWEDLDFLLNLSAEELAPLLAEHYAKAHPLMMASDQTAENVLASLAAYTQTISQLAEGFKLDVDDKGRPRKRLSLVAWAQDDYEGCPTIIAHAGPDAALTQRYLAAVIDTVVPTIMGLPDDVSEDGRAIFFVLDELSTIGRVKGLTSLVDKGRSKGCSVVVGIQDWAQIVATHGPHFAKALPGMVGSHIITQTQLGPTRQELASLLGERRVAWTVPASEGRAAATHEESRPVVTPADLTMKLGRRRGKQYPEGFAIRALACLGGDYLVLDWPGMAMPKKRRSHVPAAWTLPVEPTSGTGSEEVVFSGGPKAKTEATPKTTSLAPAALPAARPVPSPNGGTPSGSPSPAAPRERTKGWGPLVSDVATHVQAGLAGKGGAT